MMSTEASSRRWAGQSDKAHPEVYTTIPPQTGPPKPGQLTDQQLNQYFTEGFVVVDDLFRADDLEPVKADIETVVDEMADRLHKGGKITNLHKECGLFDRLCRLDSEFPGANILLIKSLGSLPQSFRSLWSHERLLNIAEQLLGTADIVGHPVWNLRSKIPRNEETTVPWHQDNAYLDPRSYDIMIPTAWIPLLDTNETNGCLQFMRCGHRLGRMATHTCCHGDTWYVNLEEDEMRRTLDIDPVKDLVTVPVPYRGAVFFNNNIPHRSLNNGSDQVRWSLDLRWCRADQCVAFHDLKDGVRMRSAAAPQLTIDWGPFDAVNRNTLPPQEDDYDTTICGPWMLSWEMVHTNRHTARLLAQTPAH